MAYFAMLSGQGWTAIAGCRQFFYARYVDWAITTPLIILELGLIAGADPSAIASAIGADGEDPPHPPQPTTTLFPTFFLRRVRLLLPRACPPLDDHCSGGFPGACTRHQIPWPVHLSFKCKPVVEEEGEAKEKWGGAHTRR